MQRPFTETMLAEIGATVVFIQRTFELADDYSVLIANIFEMNC
jgi:hypothetical protein